MKTFLRSILLTAVALIVGAGSALASDAPASWAVAGFAGNGTGVWTSGDTNFNIMPFPAVVDASATVRAHWLQPYDALVIGLHCCFESDTNNDNLINVDLTDDGTSIIETAFAVGTTGNDASVCGFADVDIDTAQRYDKIARSSVMLLKLDADGTGADGTGPAIQNATCTLLTKRTKF